MNMDRYTYLFISLFLFIPWFIIIFKRPDLRRKVIKTSLIGGVAGLIANFWYFRDYWRPPSLFGNTVISIEDFLFGFLITGIAASIYDPVFNKKYVKKHKKRKKFFGNLFLIGVIILFIFNNWLGINSIFVSSFAFLGFSIIIVSIRKDLIIPSIVSGLLVTLIIIPIYIILFNYISPTYWDKYWLLANTSFGIEILGNIPVTELIWYFTWGCFAGISYDFVSGSEKVKI
jgi:hypothetical protein